MKKSKFTESQIVKSLKENEAGRSVDEICRELGIAKGTFYNWRKKYEGMESSQLKKRKELEEENVKLKRMYADLALQNTMLKDVLGKKW
ncbi:MAG: transposase [Saprospiraceae bacterium]|nr:transposase [Saprospiraceae bacterium]